MGFGGNMQKLMKQAQKMQQDMAKVQDDLKNQQVEGTAGGGMVKVIMNCANEPLDIQINPEVIDPEDVEMLQDLVLAAFKDAMNNAAQVAADQMGKVTGGMNIPGL